MDDFGWQVVIKIIRQRGSKFSLERGVTDNCLFNIAQVYSL